MVGEEVLGEALEALDPSEKGRPGSESLAAAEEEHIRNVLEATHGNKTRAAEILGIERKTLYRKLQKMQNVSS